MRGSVIGDEIILYNPTPSYTTLYHSILRRETRNGLKKYRYMMKRMYCVLVALLSLAMVQADDQLLIEATEVDTTSVQPNFILDDMPNAAFHQDEAITNLIKDRSVGFQRGQYQKSGFRVQVYTSNDSRVAKNEALELEEKLSSKVDVTVYVSSDPPFWKVRLGDFETRDEALRYKQIINEQFPELYDSTYVVPDTITVTH